MMYHFIYIFNIKLFIKYIWKKGWRHLRKSFHSIKLLWKLCNVYVMRQFNKFHLSNYNHINYISNRVNLVWVKIINIMKWKYSCKNTENWYQNFKNISTNVMNSGYEGQYLSGWKLVVFDGLTLNNKLALIIYIFFSTINI